MATESSTAATPAIAKASQPEEEVPAIVPAIVPAVAGELELESSLEGRPPSTGASPSMHCQQAVDDARTSSSTVDVTDGKSVSGPVSDGEIASRPVTDGGEMPAQPDTDGQSAGSGGAKAKPKLERKSSIAKFIEDLESASRPVVADHGEIPSAPGPDGQSGSCGLPKARPRMEKKPSIAKFVKDLESGSVSVNSDLGQLQPSSAAGDDATNCQSGSGSGCPAKSRPRMERKSSIAKFIKDLEDKTNSDKAPQEASTSSEPIQRSAIAKADRARAVETAIFRDRPRGVAPARRFRSHLKELMDAFQVFDADRSGMISADEMVLLFKSIGIQLTEEEANSMINEVDSNGSGTLEFIEFVRMMERSVDGETSIQKKLFEAFKFFDRSGDGRISPQELQEALEKLRGEVIPIREVKIMMGKADVDGDGHISFKEFLTLLATTPFDQ